MSEPRSGLRYTPGATTNVVATPSSRDGTDVHGTDHAAQNVLIAVIELSASDIVGEAGLRLRRHRQRQRANPGIGTSRENGKVSISVDDNQIGADVGNSRGMTVQTVNISIEDINSTPDDA